MRATTKFDAQGNINVYIDGAWSYAVQRGIMFLAVEQAELAKSFGWVVAPDRRDIAKTGLVVVERREVPQELLYQQA